MKKGVVIALCAVVVVAAAGVWWWKAGDRASDRDAADRADAARLNPAEMAARAERIGKSVAHRRHLWRDASYVDIRQAAMDGDLVAQRRLSEVYEDCVVLDGSMRRSLIMLAQLANGNPSFEATVVGILRDKNRLCVQAKADLARNPGAADYWLHRSAKSGDVVSEMRYFSRTVPKLSHSQYQYFIDKVRLTGDPDAIFELSLLLPKFDGSWPDRAQAPAFQGPTAEQAWVLAACRAGYDCARGSRMMNIVCLTMLSCVQPDYERYLAESDSDPAARALRQRQLALIEGTILAPIAK